MNSCLKTKLVCVLLIFCLFLASSCKEKSVDVKRGFVDQSSDSFNTYLRGLQVSVNTVIKHSVGSIVDVLPGEYDRNVYSGVVVSADGLVISVLPRDFDQVQSREFFIKLGSVFRKARVTNYDKETGAVLLKIIHGDDETFNYLMPSPQNNTVKPLIYYQYMGEDMDLLVYPVFCFGDDVISNYRDEYFVSYIQSRFTHDLVKTGYPVIGVTGDLVGITWFRDEELNNEYQSNHDQLIPYLNSRYISNLIDSAN